MSSAIALAVASFCLAVVAALFIVAVAVITYLVHKSFFSTPEAKQEPPIHTHLSSNPDSSKSSQNQLAVYDLTSPVRPQRSHGFETQEERSQRSPRIDHDSSRGRRSNASTHGCQSPSARAMPSSRAYNPGHVATEIASPVATLDEMRKGYAALLACKFSGDVAAHLSNVSAVTDSYNMDVDDMCYCFLCLEAVTNSEGVDGLAIKPHGLNSYSARIWIVSLARFVKFAQGHHWAEDDDRVRPLAEEWQYQAEHFVQMIKSCDASFQRKHGFDLVQAFRQEDIRCKEVARAQQSMLMLGTLTAESAPRGSRLVNAPPAGSRLFGAAAGINVDAKALHAPSRPAALANAPFAGWPTLGHSVPTFDPTLHFNGDIVGGNSASMGKRHREYMQDGHASSQSSVTKRSRLALPPPESKTSKNATNKSKGGRSR